MGFIVLLTILLLSDCSPVLFVTFSSSFRETSKLAFISLYTLFCKTNTLITIFISEYLEKAVQTFEEGSKVIQSFINSVNSTE